MTTPADQTPSTPLKRFLDRRVPWLYRPIRGGWQRFRQWQFDRRYLRLTTLVTERLGWRVQSGPFMGMAYVTESCSSTLLPKLLGTYEDELHSALKSFDGTRYHAIVDIGSAEGYYAVGMALKHPTLTVYAYDLDSRARRLCGELAQLNGVADRVVIDQQFTPARLADLPAGRLLVICDVDGYETELFNPGTTDYWHSCDLLVELHDCFGHPCRDTVTQCLAKSHNIEIISTRTKVFPPGIDFCELSDADRALAMNEIRPPQEWLIARKRVASPSNDTDAAE